MSEDLEKARQALAEKFANSNVSNSVKFVIEGLGELLAENGDVRVVDGDDADLIMTASADVFEEILRGELNGASAFMSGKLKIDGDMGLAMKLGSVLG